MGTTVDIDELSKIIQEATELARQYRELTGKPLGITGEVGEFMAAQLLGLQLTGARQPGYDAIATDGRRIQIKTRCIPSRSDSGHRVGRIKFDHEWDTVALVLMDDNYDTLVIYEANRSDIERELSRPGSKARNEKGALSISKFRAIAQPVWRKE